MHLLLLVDAFGHRGGSQCIESEELQDAEKLFEVVRCEKVHEYYDVVVRSEDSTTRVRTRVTR